MAGNILINYRIDTADSGKTIGEMRKGLRTLLETQNELDRSTEKGARAYAKLSEAINRTEGRIGDLQDSMSTLRGSGVERLNGSLNLFKEGLASADPGKLSTALGGLKSAMSAVPIFLLIEGFNYLVQNFDKVKEFFTGTTNEVENQKNAMEALAKQQEENKKVLDSYLDSLNKQLETLALTNGPLAQQLALIKEKTNVQVKSLDEEIAKTKEKIAITEKEIAAENENLRAAKLSAAGVSLSYENIIKSKTDALGRTLELQKKELASLTGAEVSKANVIAKGEDEVKKKRQEAADRQEELTRKLNVLLIENTQDRQAKEIAAENERYRIAVKEAKNNAKIIEQEKIKHTNVLSSIDVKYYNEYAELINNTEVKEYERALAEQKRLKREAADFDRIFAEQSAEQDREISVQNELKRRKDNQNSRAFEKAAVKASFDERISAITLQRDTELVNTQLTEQQRVEIIKKSEAEILKVKMESAAQVLAITQQSFAVATEINNLITQGENQRLRDMQYEKDAQALNDTNRTQEAIDRETLATNTLLNNESLTTQQREAIQFQSDTRKRQLEVASKNNQIQIEQDFAKKQLEIKKKQFNREKGLKLLNIAIDTASALVKTTAELGGVGAITPPGIALLGGIAALGITQAAVVSAQKFDDGGASSVGAIAPAANLDTRGGAGGGGGGAAGGGSSVPQGFNPQAISAGGFQNGNTPDSDVKRARAQRVYVLETDIRSAAQKVDLYESRATFGE